MDAKQQKQTKQQTWRDAAMKKKKKTFSMRIVKEICLIGESYLDQRCIFPFKISMRFTDIGESN